MAEYIERNSAMKKILEIGDLNYDGMPAKIGTTHAALIIRNLPAADVAPVRHGRWKLVGADKRGRGGNWECTGRDGCGKSYPYRCDYCPNCGAKMQGCAEHVNND